MELSYENLRNWFKKEDWVRIDTQGNITGKCGTMKKGKATTRCLPRAKANTLSKKERAATARKKVRGSKKGKQFVKNTKKAKVKIKKENMESLNEIREQIFEMLTEKLCKKGKAYIAKRKRAGEKSSAYLSGRAVKVCKGQMKGEGIDESDMSIQEVLNMEIIDENITEAKYKGKTVKLNKPMRGDVKKFKVYVANGKNKDGSIKVKKVNFGHGGTSAKRPTMKIRKSNPKARAAFRARHRCDNPGPKTMARYWSCRKW